jgi:hypothetical protein
MKLWDNVFPSFFRGQEAFNKTLEFVGFNGTDLVVRRVLFRYVLSNMLLDICLQSLNNLNYILNVIIYA